MPLLPPSGLNSGQLAIGGLAEGIKSFLDTRREQQRYDDEQKMKQAGLMRQGLVKNPDTGNYDLTPEAQAQQKAGLIKAQNTIAEETPDSAVAKSLGALNQGLIKQSGLQGVDLSGMTPSQMKDYINPQLDTAAKFATARATKDAARITKSGQREDTALKDTKALLESARGNPAAAQAERDIYASQKADSLANLYGDPNKLSPQMVQLLQGEVAKIAQGGTPSIHELQGLDVKTMPKMLASAMQSFTNKPSPANAGEFVKQYQDYAHALTKDAQDFIQEKYGRVIESSKRQLGDDNYNALKSQYLDRFSKGNTKSGLLGNQPSKLDPALRAKLLDLYNQENGAK